MASIVSIVIERTGGAKGRSVSAMVLAVAGVECERLSLTLDSEANLYVAADGSTHTRLASAVLSNLRVAESVEPSQYFQLADMKETYQYSTDEEGTVRAGGWGKETTLSTWNAEQLAQNARLCAADARTVALCKVAGGASTGKGARLAKDNAAALASILG